MKNNKKGFTLAELLIVVAIIAVLVAIAIPIFTSQLEKSREATDKADIRDYYAEISVAVLDETLTYKTDGSKIKIANGLEAVSGAYTAATDSADGSFTVTVAHTAHQSQTGWQSGNPVVAGVTVNTNMADTTAIVYTFAIDKDNGNIYLTTYSFTAA